MATGAAAGAGAADAVRLSIRSSNSDSLATRDAGSACAFSARSTRSAIFAICALVLFALLSMLALSEATSAESCVITPRNAFTSMVRASSEERGCGLAKATAAIAPTAEPSAADTAIAIASTAARLNFWRGVGV